MIKINSGIVLALVAPNTELYCSNRRTFQNHYSLTCFRILILCKQHSNVIATKKNTGHATTATTKNTVILINGLNWGKKCFHFNSRSDL